MTSSFWRRSSRRAFTLVEVSLATALATVILIVVFDVFLAGRRNTTILNRSLEANEAVLKTFRSLTRDIRSARKVGRPELAPADAEMPEFSWSSQEDGTHRLDLQIFDLVLVNGQLMPKTKLVMWFLDEPKTPPRGGETTYSMFRAEQDFQDAAAEDSPAAKTSWAPTGMKPPVKVAEGIRELVFFRKKEEQGESQPGAGPRNVQVRMVSSRLRKTKDGRMVPGYTAELVTTVHIRGGK